MGKVGRILFVLPIFVIKKRGVFLYRALMAFQDSCSGDKKLCSFGIFEWR
jgi:hypothetical protein